MERYLLFDGGCTMCTGLAQEIEQATNGWLTARSLRDAAMKELLDTARPGWKWEPTLVEVDDAHVRVFTGIKMRSRLVIGLGPRRAVRVAQLVQEALTPKAEVDQGRRTFLKRGAMMAGLLIAGPKIDLSRGKPRERPPDGADDDWLTQLDIQEGEAEELTGKLLVEATDDFKFSADVKQIYRAHKLKSEKKAFKAVRHTLADGNTLTVVATVVGTSVVVRYTLAQPVAGTSERVHLYNFSEVDEQLSLVAESSNGSLSNVSQAESSMSSQAETSARRRSCPNGTVRCWNCVETDIPCLRAGCLSCVWTCATGGAIWCAVCISVWCPMSIYRCCRRWGWLCCPPPGGA